MVRTTQKAMVTVFGAISANFHSIKGYDDYLPVHFMHHSVPHEERLSLYTVSSICFVSSTRDGMNLVACEYTAVQKERHGVLLLSEFTGAAEHLRRSLLCKPSDVGEMVDAIYEAKINQS